MEFQAQEQEKGQREHRFIRYIPAVYASLMAVGAMPVLQGALSLPGPTFALFVLMAMIFRCMLLKQRMNELLDCESRLKDYCIESRTKYVEALERLVEQTTQLLKEVHQENQEYHRESIEGLRQEKARLEALCVRRVREEDDLLKWMSDDEILELFA